MTTKIALSKNSGVVLIMALIMLVIISLLSVTTMRNATNTESIVNTVRTGDLAQQAAELALRHCEGSVVSLMEIAKGNTSTFVTTFPNSRILPPSTTPRWQNITAWDAASPTSTFVLPIALVNQAALTSTYRRAPECMVEQVSVLQAGTSTVNSTSTFIVTARGFGPEVTAGTGRPQGSEIWLQSLIELED